MHSDHKFFSDNFNRADPHATELIFHKPVPANKMEPFGA